MRWLAILPVSEAIARGVDCLKSPLRHQCEKRSAGTLSSFNVAYNCDDRLVNDDRVVVSIAGRSVSYVPLGTGDPLVCIVGGPGLAGDTLGNLGGLDRDWSLVRPDLRGAGLSDPPADGRYRLSDYVADIELFRDELGLERMNVVSHSFGSLVALAYAATHPERVERLIVDGIPDWRNKEKIASLSLPEHFTRAEDASSFGEALLAGWNWTPFDWFVEHEFFSVDPRADMARVAAPTLVVTGEHDVTFGPECAETLAALSPHATVGVVPGANHFTWFEEPVAYSTLVRDFLRAATI